jgi:hypothetical protein
MVCRLHLVDLPSSGSTLKGTPFSSSPDRCRNLRPVPPAVGVSASVHSKYQRRLADLPSQRRLVGIQLWSRCFRCTAAECCRKSSRSGSRQPAPVHSPAGRHVWKRSSIILAWRWVVGQGRASPNACCSQSARTRCYAWCVVRHRNQRRRRGLLVITHLPGALSWSGFTRSASPGHRPGQRAAPPAL